MIFVTHEEQEAVWLKADKTLKFMNADLLLIQASLTEFIEFIKSDPKIFTFVKSEDLNQGAIEGVGEHIKEFVKKAMQDAFKGNKNVRIK